MNDVKAIASMLPMNATGGGSEMTGREAEIVKAAVEELKNLDERRGYDQIDCHGRADDILCEVLRGLGHAAVAEAFEEARKRVRFWYS
jgi:hypothetical protein